MSKHIELTIIEGIPYKKCTKCKLLKSYFDFCKNARQRFGINNHCKSCASEIEKEYKIKNPEYARNHHLKQTYDITLEDYNKLYQEQSGQCAICNRNFEKLDVDHCHYTNKIRGLLCEACNTALGLLNDDPIRAENLIRYLLKNKELAKIGE